MKCDPAVPLRAGAVYLAPSGRLCRWVPRSGDHHQITSYATFEYLPEPGRRPRHGARALWADQFVLTPGNYQLLKEAPHATAR